jgi:hypothetical protein
MPNGLDALASKASTQQSGLSLLFRPGERPSADDLIHLIDSGQASGPAARVSHRPDARHGWLELLASGLTFDVRGLSPLEALDTAPLDSYGNRVFGFTGSDPERQYEAVEIALSHHIMAGAGLQPVVRTMVGLAANLTAVRWHPADTLMEPRYFVRVVLAWLAGGAFPALGLTALTQAQDGSIASRGLAHFTGQEMRLEATAGESPAEAVQLAIRVIDDLVREGRIATPRKIGAGKDALLAEPSQVGKLVLVWRAV